MSKPNLTAHSLTFPHLKAQQTIMVNTTKFAGMLSGMRLAELDSPGVEVLVEALRSEPRLAEAVQ